MISRTRSLAVVAIGALLAVTACGSSDKGSTQTEALAGIKVVGNDPKKAPVVTLSKKPFSVTRTTTQVLRAGTGEVLTDKDIASLSMEVVNGKDGKAVNSNFETGAAGLYLGDANLLKGLKTGVTGQRVGSRLLVAVPPADGFGAQGATQLGIGAADTMLFVVDIASASRMLDVATGAAVAPQAGLPTVKFLDGKPAVITAPKTTPPTKTVVQPLIMGSGAVVKTGQTVTVT
ncbi:MAG: FKBP-type peptidyl-prolyl cis-trans isomerase, partial [Nostocoides sp.]